MSEFLEHRRSLADMVSLLPADCQGKRSAPSRLLRSFATDTLKSMVTVSRGYDPEAMQFIADALREELFFAANEFTQQKMAFVIAVAPVAVSYMGPEFRIRNTFNAYDEYQNAARQLRDRSARRPLEHVNHTRGSFVLYSMHGIITRNDYDYLSWHGENYLAIEPLRATIRDRSASSVADVQNLIDSVSGDHSLVLAEGVL